MYRQRFNKTEAMRFKHFTRRSYALFNCLGREVLICTLSVATLSYAKASGISTNTEKADTALTGSNRTVVLGEVEVTASKAPLGSRQSARMVTVLDRADIAAAPVQSVNDLLKYAVGVDVRQRGPIGAQADVGIRGGNYEQVAILLNGINICDPQTGHNAFDLPVDVGEIERIEVLEGPAGRVYGASSLLGAINIVTRMPSKASLSAKAEGGSYGYASAAARGNFVSGGWNNSLSGAWQRSDGYSRSKSGRLNADFKSLKGFYQGRYDDNAVSVRWHAGISSKDFGSNTFYGAKWDNQFEHTFKSFTAVQAQTLQGSLRLRPSIYWNRNMDRFELFRGSEADVPYNYHRTDVYGANLNAYFDWALGRTAFGADIRNEDLVSTTLGEELQRPSHVHGTQRDYLYGLDRTNVSFTIEHNILLPRFTLSAGLVAVKNSWNRMNMRVYPGIDASYAIIDGLKIYASYNTSLRMPSVTELYYSVGGYKADKYLKPEELTALEGGLKYASRFVTAKAAVYHNRCKNMIDWIRDTGEGVDAPWQSVNFTKVNSTGLEVSARADLASAMPWQHVLRSFDVAYSYIDQDKVENGGIQSMSTLEYLRHKFVASLALDLARRLSFALHYRFNERTGSYTDVNGMVQPYKPYGIVDARLSWNEKYYSIYLEANNVFDKTYVDIGNVAQPGAWFIGGLKVDL